MNGIELNTHEVQGFTLILLQEIKGNMVVSQTWDTFALGPNIGPRELLGILLRMRAPFNDPNFDRVFTEFRLGRIPLRYTQADQDKGYFGVDENNQPVSIDVNEYIKRTE